MDLISIKLSKNMDFNKNNFNNIDYRMLAITCLIISSKFSENDPNIPNIRDYCVENFTDYFSISDLKNLEVKCLMFLSYKLNNYCPYSYLKIFFCMGFIFQEDYEIFSLLQENEKDNNSNNKSEVKNIIIFENLLDQIYFFCEDLIYFIIV